MDRPAMEKSSDSPVVEVASKAGTDLKVSTMNGARYGIRGDEGTDEVQIRREARRDPSSLTIIIAEFAPKIILTDTEESVSTTTDTIKTMPDALVGRCGGVGIKIVCINASEGLEIAVNH